MATAAVFSGSVGFMALKPLLLHLSSERSDGDRGALPPACFQLAAELAKVVLCTGVLLSWCLVGRPAALWSGWSHTASFLPPAAVYLFMNVTTVRAARLLSPPIFQLVATVKILCTAIVARLLRGQEFTPLQWLALVVLTLGVAIGQWEAGGSEEGAAQGAGSGGQALGVALMFVNSWLSALGGVLTEGVLKAPASARLSVYARNIHMATHTLVLNGLFLALQPWVSGVGPAAVGWPAPLEAAAVVNEAVNGIVISFLISRFDSITKNYAFGLSVFATAGMAAVFMDHRPRWNFYVGASVSLASLFLYARGRAKAAKSA